MARLMTAHATIRNATIFFLALLSPWLISGDARCAEPERPNILFIAVDDLRPQLGCYGDRVVISPHIDSLAERGMIFERAYCQVAICNPSRASLMTGLRPDSVRVWDLRVHFRETLPEAVTLPQHLRRHGYHAVGMGKIYHNPFPDPQSWSEPHLWPEDLPSSYPEGTDERIEARKKELVETGKDNHLTSTLRGPSTAMPDYADEDGHDGALASLAIGKLAELKAREQPFFLAVGFIRPHLAFIAPKRYWDLYDRDKLPLAANPFLPEDMPEAAIAGNHELTHYMDLAEFPSATEDPIDEETARRLVHGYFACVSYVDAQIGRLIKALEEQGLADNTLIVLWGDHGWKLGEHNGWGKFTNFEIDTRAPLIVVDPRMKKPGRRCSRLVEFIDIYPTLCDLAGIPAAEHLEGRSLKPLLRRPNAPFKGVAFSQFSRRIDGATLMGYSMRTEHHRYAEWRDCEDGEVRARELYHHRSDPGEDRNLANQEDQGGTIEALAARLAEHFPPGPLDLTPAIHSRESTLEVPFEVHNKLDSPVQIAWISPSGARRWMEQLEPGESYQTTSYAGHVFVLEALDGTLHRIVHADYPRRTITLTPEGGEPGTNP